MALNVDYRESRFVQALLADPKMHITNAAIAAGYSAASASTIGSELLAKPKIQEALHAEMDARAMRTRITADLTLAGIARLALSDVRRVFYPDGTIRPVDTWDDDIAMAVQSVKVKEDPETGARVTEIRLADKAKPLDMLARHLGLLTTDKERNESISDLLKAVLLEMRERQPKDVTPAADWAPLAAPAHALPAPPAPDETD